jgi:hypothetical protein
MDIYLPIIQVMLADWLQVSEEHPLLVAAIAFCVWILISILYSFRTSSLKKQVIALDTAKTTAETALETAQQQQQQAQDDLSTANQHFSEQKQAADTLQQRAENVEKQLAERNKQLAAIIQKFASSFDIGERPVPVTADLKADDLWQQHDKAINKLLDNLRTETLAKNELQKFYQAEQDKVVAIETRLHSLQASLDEQTSLLTTLQNQNNALQQQQNSAQHELSAAMQKHQADLARLTQLEVNALQTAPAPVIQTAPPVDDTDKLKNLFKKTEAKPVIEVAIATPEPVPTPAPAPAPAPAAIVTDVLITATTNEPPAPVVQIINSVESTPEPIAETAKPAANLKGLYNKFSRKSTAKATPVVQEKPKTEPKKESSEKAGLKGLYNKFANKPAVAEQPIIAETKPAPAPAAPTPAPVTETKIAPEPIMPSPTAAPSNKAKTAYRVPDSKLSDDIPSTRIEDIADKITDTVEGFKKLFSKKS